MKRADVAIIGGSGLCQQDVFPVLATLRPNTPFGYPSGEISLCRYEDASGMPRTLAFLPRHGPDHALAPHAVPYAANIAALASLGVRQIIATCIAGSLRRRIQPGDFVIPDQFVNLTWGRDPHQKEPPIHTPLAEPYCPSLRALLTRHSRKAVRTHVSGTVAVIQGPRFSTRAESRWLARQGWHLVNMTQYPECYLAREAGLCYATLAAITDHDVGVRGRLTQIASDRPFQAVLDIFHRNIASMKELLRDLLPLLPLPGSCTCAMPFPPEYYKQPQSQDGATPQATPATGDRSQDPW